MRTVIIILHQELVHANRLAHIRHDLRDLGPSMHAMVVIGPHMIAEPQLPHAVAPRLDAEFILRITVPFLVHRWGAAWLGEFAAGHGPAVFGDVLAARDAVVDVRGGWSGAAFVGDGVGVAELVGIVFKVHVGGELGLRAGEVVVLGAEAGGLAEGIEVRGPPDGVPDLEVLGPVVLVDGAGVGGVPGLVEVGAFGVGVIREGGDGFFDGVVGDLGVLAIEDADGAGGRCCDIGAVDDAVFSVKVKRLGGNRICRRHGDHGGRRGRSRCRGFHQWRPA